MPPLSLSRKATPDEITSFIFDVYVLNCDLTFLLKDYDFTLSDSDLILSSYDADVIEDLFKDKKEARTNPFKDALSDAQKQEILDKYTNHGESPRPSIRSLASEYNVARGTIAKAIVEAGVAIQGGHAANPLTDSERTQIIRARKSGQKVSEIASSMKRDFITIARALAREKMMRISEYKGSVPRSSFAEIYRRYTQEEESAHTIGVDLGYGEKVIETVLAYLNIEIRDAGEYQSLLRDSAEVDRIVDMFVNKRYAIMRIARETRHGDTPIRKALIDRLGEDGYYLRVQRKVVSQNEIEEAQNLRAEGFTYKEIGEILNLDPHTVSKYVKE